MKQGPSNLKFKKYHKPKISFFNLKAQKNFLPKNGYYGLKSLQSGKVTYNQIESGRRTIKRSAQKYGFLWINLFTYASVTNKPVASRMGKGKGNHSHWVCPVRVGQIIYEVSGLPKEIAFKSLKNAGDKLCIKTRIINLIY